MAKKAETPKKPKTEKYTLITNVSIGGELKKKGEKVDLTKEGYKFFKQKKYVK
jgi:hypothetical protein